MKKKVFSLGLALVLSLSLSMTAFAAEPVNAEEVVSITADVSGDEGVMPLSSHTITTDKDGAFSNINVYGPCNLGVLVREFDPGKYQMDIQMWGRNGLLWSENECLHNASSRVFECSSEVRSVSIRIVPRNTWFPAPNKSFTVELNW